MSHRLLLLLGCAVLAWPVTSWGDDPELDKKAWASQGNVPSHGTIPVRNGVIERHFEKLLTDKLDDQGKPFALGLSPLTTDRSLKELSDLKNVVHLCLGNSVITDAGLKELAHLKMLTALDLTSTRVSDAGLKDLAGFKDLTELSLMYTAVTDEGLKELAPFKKLNGLYLDARQTTDTGLRRLQEIGLLHAYGQAFHKGYNRPKSADEVLRVILSYTKVTDEGVKELAAFKNLTTLHLSGTAVTNASVKELIKFKKLASLEVIDTKIDGEGLALLKKGLPNCKITDQYPPRAPGAKAEN